MLERVLIRPAEQQDIAQIVALCEEHAAYEKSLYRRVGKQGLLQVLLFDSSPSLFCLVAVRDDTVFGYATYSEQLSTWEANSYLYLDCLFLKEEIRGQGVGKGFMSRIKKKADHLGISMQWQTPIFNSGAIDFYHSLGATHREKLRFFW